MSENRTQDRVNYNLVEMSPVVVDKKLILVNENNKSNYSMFNLQSGKHIFHIYNRSLVQK
jgi:hypothetical protein